MKGSTGQYGNEIYLDNNAYHYMNSHYAKIIVRDINKPNPNQQSKGGKQSRELINSLKDSIQYIVNIHDAQVPILVPSGSDGNVDILTGCVLEKKVAGKRVRMLVSSIEHSSIRHLCEIFKRYFDVDVQYIQPDYTGLITISNVMKLMDDSIDIVSIMHASNESGIVNDVDNIAKAIKNINPNCIVHSDCVQTFMKRSIEFENIDAITISFYKLGGPVGIAMIITKPQLHPIFLQKGSIANQRGGSINMGLVSAAKEFVDNTRSELRTIKAESISQRQLIIDTFKEKFNVLFYNDMLQAIQDSKNHIPEKDFLKENSTNIIIFGFADQERQLSNTILVSLVEYKDQHILSYCKIKVRDELEKKGIIIGLGSACDSTEKGVSNLAFSSAIGLFEFLNPSILRISTQWIKTSEDTRQHISKKLTESLFDITQSMKHDILIKNNETQ